MNNSCDNGLNKTTVVAGNLAYVTTLANWLCKRYALDSVTQGICMPSWEMQRNRDLDNRHVTWVHCTSRGH